jgi:murein DD-endopeptidase MepM/ murein hydrolase activator NlpD
MRPLVRVVLLLCPLLAFACEDRPIAVTHEQSGQTVRLFAETRDGIHLTVTLQAELTNMTSSPALPLTVDLAGRGKKLLAELRVANPSQAWRWRYHYRYYRGNRGGRPAEVLYRLPYRPEERYRVGQGNLGKFSHGPGTGDEYAFDFDMPVGTVICAARDGVVAGVRTDSTSGGGSRDFGNCANYVMIRHDDGTYADYLHLQTGGALVKMGERVKAGQPIARSGHTGYSTHPHLHFVVYRPIDGTRRESLPIKFALPGQTGPQRLVQGRTY